MGRDRQRRVDRGGTEEGCGGLRGEGDGERRGVDGKGRRVWRGGVEGDMQRRSREGGVNGGV